MTYDLLSALAAFAFVTSITPGPNNIMLMTSGATFGIRRTVPHMLGVGIGFTVLVLGVGAGLAGLFQAWPPAQAILRIASMCYLLWLAWVIATRPAMPQARQGAAARPMTFLEAAAFQWINPKAWTMALTAVTAYAPGNTAVSVLIVAAVFGAINLPSVGTWVLMGQALARWLARPPRMRIFNLAMAALLVASLFPVSGL